ncbi:hypothetical protein F2P56_012445 [Juglans regia]|uniref:Retrotransposon Copia-like N-terminal domain-containing protein n=2 Tax=Juglans regia TaxID=51240 RepID=A0A833XIV5_JUGRE|nr:uncharacterized protein LOC109019705 [Juglans regia]KAF5468281.1 hypothetical protein F2P56_012445 [Juglans regia]
MAQPPPTRNPPPGNPPTANPDHPSNPYYLHYSESPSTMLVSQPLSVLGENYHYWRQSMLIALEAKNKHVFLDGTLACPNQNNPLFGACVLYIANAKEVWDDLRDRFSQANGPRIFQLQSQISGLSQGALSVSAYFTILKGLWDELSNYKPLHVCSCGALKEVVAVQHSEYVIQFLVGLNESFSAVRAQILLMVPLPPINQVFSLVHQEERQREILPTPPVEPIALLSRQDYIKANRQPFSRAKERPLCSHCASTMSFTTEQYQQLISLLNSNSVQPTGSTTQSANLAFSHNISGPYQQENNWSG